MVNLFRRVGKIEDA